jgi:ATP-dependent helicase/nuclease subunit B
MRVLSGLGLGGATLTERDDLPLGKGAIGDVCWGPAELLRDLELRLGLSGPRQPHAVRVARFAARMAKLAPRGRYYSRSFEVDALGTAASGLELRDLLVEAGWRGQFISDGGARLDALHELEQLDDPALPTGDADRVAAIGAELSRRSTRLYAEVALVEPSESWSTCWREVFHALERAGTRLKRGAPLLPGAPEDTDLGRMQHALASGSAQAPVELSGDGSFAVLTAETSWHAAQAVAALLARLPAEDTAVIREHDASALDHALGSAGLRTLGLRSTSAWRSALQVLPLALELSFEPKDPYRVLELLTLPLGPFSGFVGHALARALAESPGIGSPSWEAVKEYVRSKRPPERAGEPLARIEAWLEAPAVEAGTAAPIPTLLTVLDRVRDWLVARIQASPDDSLLLAAAQQAAGLRTALQSDPRPTLTLVQVRKLAESVLASGTAAELLRERAGRVALVDSASGLRRPYVNVVWWPFTAAANGVAVLPWRRHELTALAAANLRFPDPGRRLSEQAAAARSAFLCAKERLVLVLPRDHAGQPLPHHPLWDELLASARLDEAALDRVTVSAVELTDPDSTSVLRDRPFLSTRFPVDLPGGHSEWVVPAEHITTIDRFSPASLEALLGCSLEWALRYRAGAHPGGHTLPPLYLLNGSLGHRLVELLHAGGAFDLEEESLRRRAEADLATLFRKEGAVLLRPGMTFERGQLEQQLLGAAVELSRLLRGAGLRIVAVEKSLEIAWHGGKLEGRLDLLVVSPNGEHAIIDMKGGMSIYRDLLRAGRALQLALYAFAHSVEHEHDGWPDAGYFSLKQGKLFGPPSRVLPHAEVVPGPPLSDTWRRVERSVARALPLARQGRFFATGVRGAPSPLQTLGVPEAEADAHFALPSGARCQYCRYDALCGRRWEALQ